MFQFRYIIFVFQYTYLNMNVIFCIMENTYKYNSLDCLFERMLYILFVYAIKNKLFCFWMLNGLSFYQATTYVDFIFYFYYAQGLCFYQWKMVIFYFDNRYFIYTQFHFFLSLCFLFLFLFFLFVAFLSCLLLLSLTI